MSTKITVKTSDNKTIILPYDFNNALGLVKSYATKNRKYDATTKVWFINHTENEILSDMIEFDACLEIEEVLMSGNMYGRLYTEVYMSKAEKSYYYYSFSDIEKIVKKNMDRIDAIEEIIQDIYEGFYAWAEHMI